MTKIDIFSGFLGAGKTTLIKKLLKEALAGEKVVLIENEFGEIGIDGGFMKEAGAAVVGSGRSDFKNQINNVLAFPGIFRGALDVRAGDINEEMKMAASYAIAGLVSDEERCADYIMPKAFDKRVGPAVAAAVAEAARKSGVARI